VFKASLLLLLTKDQAPGLVPGPMTTLGFLFSIDMGERHSEKPAT
jgi:hypothetical protein